MYKFQNLMLNIECMAWCTSSLSWINQNWIRSTIFSITHFLGGFKEWNLEEFQRIHWVILYTGSEYSKNWRIAKIEEVSGSIIRFYVMIGWWWWFNVKFYYLIYSWMEGRGKDREFKSLLILEDCIFLLEVYPFLYIWKL